jgi:hypothetical protein
MKRLFLFFAAAALLSCAVKGPIDLALRPAAGMVYRLRLSSSQTVKQTIEGKSTVVSQQTAMTYAFKILSVDPSGLTSVQTSYEDLSLSVRGPEISLDFDSDSPQNVSPALAPLAGLIGDGFIYSVDARGEVSGIRGLKELTDRILSKAESSVAPILTPILQTLFTQEAVKASLASFFGFYPRGKVSVGDAWNAEQSAGGNLPMDMVNRWTLQSISGKRARLSLETTVSNLNPRSGVMISGTNEGTLEVELSTGVPVSASFKQKMSGSVMIEGSVVPIEISGTVRIE